MTQFPTVRKNAHCRQEAHSVHKSRCVLWAGLASVFLSPLVGQQTGLAQQPPAPILAPAPQAEGAPAPEPLDTDEPGVVQLAPAPPVYPRSVPTQPAYGPRPQPAPYAGTSEAVISEHPARFGFFHMVPTPAECLTDLKNSYYEKQANPVYFDDYIRNGCFLYCPWCPSQCKDPREEAMREYMTKLEKDPNWQAALARDPAARARLQAGLALRFQVDLPGYGSSRVVYPTNPYYSDPRDAKVYAAQGYGMPVGMPLAPNVEQTYNYSHGTPASRLTPVARMPATP